MKLGQLETAALTVEFNTAPNAWEFYLFLFIFSNSLFIQIKFKREQI